MAKTPDLKSGVLHGTCRFESCTLRHYSGETAN